ncbi:hypothetical protein [uncultured Mediterranean phage uvDeep-CGR2-AD7-C12]|nr:hypothetical protein [uncultured Mediterranean phage uvDeep-CGR2-AD7-C12]
MTMTPEQTTQTVEDLLRALATALRPYLDLGNVDIDTFDDLFLAAVSRHDILREDRFDPSDYEIVTHDDVGDCIDNHLTYNSEYVTLDNVQEWLGSINWAGA